MNNSRLRWLPRSTYSWFNIKIQNYCINYKKNKKNKITDLIDISGDITKSEIENYEKSLNYILSLIDPYMKEEIHFTLKEYDRSIATYRVIYFQI